MSYAVAGHVQFRLTQIAGGAELSLQHRAVEMIEEEHRQNVAKGWSHNLQTVKTRAEASSLS